MRLPKANTWFQNLTDSDLSTYAQGVHDGLTAAAATFPTPPISLVDLQALITTYNAALALAIGPGAGIANTAAKNAAKNALQNALRINKEYVNQVVALFVNAGGSYDDAKTMIISTGYQLSKEPVPAGPLPAVVVIKYGSFAKGTFYILLEKVVNAKGYVVRIINTTTMAVTEQSFPSTRLNILGLTSGQTYTFQIAAIGANTNRNFSTQIADVVVI